ncbi:hypothetical protein COHA_007330, partial [Chlorella ohadii]
ATPASSSPPVPAGSRPGSSLGSVDSGSGTATAAAAAAGAGSRRSSSSAAAAAAARGAGSRHSSSGSSSDSGSDSDSDSDSDRSTQRQAQRAAYMAKVRFRWHTHGFPHVESVEDAERELRKLQGSRPFSGLLGHMHLGPNQLLQCCGFPVALALLAFEQQRCLFTTVDRPYAHSEHLPLAAAHPLFGPFAVYCFGMAGRTAEQAVQHLEGGRLQVKSMQVILNLPGKSGPHKDSGDSSPSSDGASVATGSCKYRAVVRAGLEPLPDGGAIPDLGGFVLTFSQVAAGGGVVMLLGQLALVASAAILGKRSELYHMVAVLRSTILSFLVELDDTQPSEPSYLQQAMLPFRAEQPPALPPLPSAAVLNEVMPAGPAGLVLKPVGPSPKLHNTSAAGKVGGTVTMAMAGVRPDDGASVQASNMGQTAWALDREGKLEDAAKGALAGGAAARDKKAGAMADPSFYGRQRAESSQCNKCLFLVRSQAVEVAGGAEAAAAAEKAEREAGGSGDSDGQWVWHGPYHCKQLCKDASSVFVQRAAELDSNTKVRLTRLIGKGTKGTYGEDGVQQLFKPKEPAKGLNGGRPPATEQQKAATRDRKAKKDKARRAAKRAAKSAGA